MSSEVSRELGSFTCRSCRAVLFARHRDVSEITCPFCAYEADVPARLLDDLELGRRLPRDVEGESHKAIEEAIDARYEELELAPRILLGLALLGTTVAIAGVLYGASWSATGIGAAALGGFFVVALPVGFAAQWMSTIARNAIVARASASLSSRSLHCPCCNAKLMPVDVCGTARCGNCREALALTPQAVIEDAPPRAEAWRAAVDTDLEAMVWLRAEQWTTAQRAMLAFVAVISLAVVAFIFVV